MELPAFTEASAEASSDAFPAGSAALTLQGPAGAIEAMVEVPDAAVALPAPGVVAIVCHPLPTEGGTMQNKVVVMAARSLRELGATTVRFNFRGTGASAGAFDNGRGERDDLLAVVAWVRAQRPGADLWLGGFSFGAYVSLCVAAQVAPALLVSIAPPAGRWDFDAIEPPQGPWLVVQGEQDEIVDPQAVYDYVDGLAKPPVLVRMPDTTHFFHRKLIDLRGAIQATARTLLPQLPPAS